ncbi:MAG: rhodanese-like domain-containing protein [Candidatus Poriferisodalaceae bacterium]|nr:MAG: thiosulfate sulfurtransferase [Acidimicrobiales bacterium MED-G01]
MTTDSVSVSELVTAINGTDEIAIIDPRDHETYSEGHLLWAASLRLDDALVAAEVLLPRLSTPIVIAGEEEDEARAVQSILTENGWTNVTVLEGGIESWAHAGHELYSGVNVPSKLFGELVERHYGTPHVKAEQLNEWISEGRRLVVLDSRTEREFNRMSIPTGRSCPGGELVHRVFDLLEQDATVVVNCAGRTRSILGAESLVRAGIPNDVVALENGTMGWELADLTLEHGNDDVTPTPTSTGRQQALKAAQEVSKRFDVSQITSSIMNQWKSDDSRTLYQFDVRTPAEYKAGHRAGFRNAPGGQLIQATDEYAITRGSRVVLADDDLTRATMAASWLMEMGWETHVLNDEPSDESSLEHGTSELTFTSPQVVLPYDPGDAHVARRAMQQYLDWEVALVDQYDRDALARFTHEGWA